MLMFAIRYFAPSRAREPHCVCVWVARFSPVMCMSMRCVSVPERRRVSSWTSSYLPTSLSSSLTSKMQTKCGVCKVNKRGGSHVFMYNFLLHRTTERPNSQLNDQFESVCKKRACSAAFAVLNFLWHQQPQKNNINWHFMFFFRIVSSAKCVSERMCLCVCARLSGAGLLDRTRQMTCLGFTDNVLPSALSLVVSHKHENEMWRWQDNKNYACMPASCSLLDHWI